MIVKNTFKATDNRGQIEQTWFRVHPSLIISIITLSYCVYCSYTASCCSHWISQTTNIMEVPSKTSKPYAYWGNDERKRRESRCSTIAMAGENNEECVLAAVNKLTKLLEGQYARRFVQWIRTQGFCRYMKTREMKFLVQSTNCQMTVFGYVGEMQYGFVACTSDRFHQVYLETYRNETLTRFRNATVLMSCVTLCLATTKRLNEMIVQSHFLTQLKIWEVGHTEVGWWLWLWSEANIGWRYNCRCGFEWAPWRSTINTWERSVFHGTVIMQMLP